MVPLHACEVIPGRASAGFVLSCEHASATLPDPWRWPEQDRWLLEQHWSHDLGAAQLTREIAARAEAPAVLAGFSRLLIDANRPLASPTLIRERADERPVHLNIAVAVDDRAGRVAYWEAYHAQLAELASLPGVHTLFAVHSFTESYEGSRRPFEIGVLFDREHELANQLAAATQMFAETRLNEPYSGKQGLIYAAQRHADDNGLRALEIEVRQDRIVDVAFRQHIVDAVVEVLACAP